MMQHIEGSGGISFLGEICARVGARGKDVRWLGQ